VTIPIPRPVPWVAKTRGQLYRSLAARHAIFCEGEGGEVLEVCTAESDVSLHDEFDVHADHFGVTLGRRTIATGRLILSESPWSLPTGRILSRLEDAPKLQEGVRYSEPSRVGMVTAYQRTAVGLIGLLGLIGLIADVSIDRGFDHYLLTLRGDLVRSVSWFPWILSPPFDYPASEGGPIIKEPVWPATLNLHELVVATHWRPPSIGRAIFATDPSWFDPSKVTPAPQLRARIRRNQTMVRDVTASWSAGDYKLATLRNEARQ
jgi:hypothetical protein